MKKLIKALGRGFVGGADFTQLITERFILEDKILKVTIPISNVAARQTPKEVNYPYRNKNWFSTHQRIYSHQTYVHIYTRVWVYLPIIGILPSSEYGMLGCSFHIRKAPKGVNALDNKALGLWLNQEYDEYYNHPEPGERGIGWNTKLRNEMSKHKTLDDETMQIQTNAYINASGYPAIPAATMVDVNNTQWVFFQLLKPNHRSRTDMYCLGLDEGHYLVVDFSHQVDRSDKHKKWRKAANQTQQRVMEMVSLTDYVAEEPQTLLTNDTSSAPQTSFGQETA
ncbi:hypothetical protein [Shewanella glacialimarina]|uniref:hypothetical protein n=1 Tax=Shewanella glacialimarina TaxID=2590884 RepID=UPI001CF8E0AB|nr:hypothetical protein [Shewanella glacialimarina]UCX03319.1 hypothetical protein FJ709_01560 [Shewanella glacialimarina]